MILGGANLQYTFECGILFNVEKLAAIFAYTAKFTLCPQNLWICLICGHIGCGRYVSRHAYKHFEETQHTYAMQLTNHRVWDYAGGMQTLDVMLHISEPEYTGFFFNFFLCKVSQIRILLFM